MLNNILIILIELMIIFIITYLLFIIIRQKRVIKYESRFAKFSLTTKNENTKSLFDKIKSCCLAIFSSFGNFLNHFKIFRKLSLSYEKMVLTDDNLIKAIDYIVIKIFVALIFVVFNFVMHLLQVNFLGGFGYVLFAFFGYFLPDFFWKIEYHDKCELIEENWTEAVVIMNSSFQKNKTMSEAIDAVTKELSGPIVNEFRQIKLEIEYGLSAAKAFERFYERVKIPEILYLVESLNLVMQINGSYATTFANLEQTLLSKKHTEEQLNPIIQRTTYLYKSLCILPLIVLLVICIYNFNFVWSLFFNNFGQIIIAFSFLLYISYLLVMKMVFEVNI